MTVDANLINLLWYLIIVVGVLGMVMSTLALVITFREYQRQSNPSTLNRSGNNHHQRNQQQQVNQSTGCYTHSMAGDVQNQQNHNQES